MSKDAAQPDPVPSTYERLAAPFSLDEHAKVPKGGMTQTYAPWTSYVERLNEVLGAEHWSFRVIREGFTPTECWVLGEITATIDGETVTRQQYGCEPIVKGQRETPTTDLLKTAASDAIKKAASLIGPGLYLSIKEEREVIDAAMQEAIRAAAAEKRNAEEAKKANPTSGRSPTPAPTSAAGPTSTASRSASTPSAAPAAPSSSSTTATAAVLTGADPTVLKTKAELVERLNRGLEVARSLGLDPKPVDGMKLNRAELEETIEALLEQCKAARVAKRAS